MPKYKVYSDNLNLMVCAKLKRSEKIELNHLNYFSQQAMIGFLAPSYEKKMVSSVVNYSGPASISLDKRLKKSIDYFDFFLIVAQIVDMIQRVKQKYCRLQNVVLDLEHVYINERTSELFFLYLPLDGSTSSISVKQFIKSIIYQTKPINTEDKKLITEFSYSLDGFDFSDTKKIEAYIRKIDPDIIKTIKGRSGDVYEYEDEDDDDEGTRVLTDDDDDATTLLEKSDYDDGDEGTTVLMEDDMEENYPYLMRVSTNEEIDINKVVFRLGKDRRNVDYFVDNNNAVSRSHVNIVTRGDQYFVMDLNSKNKTFINDVALDPQTEVQIYDGDRLCLGNEEFIFYER